MALQKLLVANRGEIAIRVMRAAADLGVATVAVHPADDAESLHTRMADEAHLLEGRGAAAYLDIAQLVQLAVQSGCDSVHPGYGFLAENPRFASACEAAGLVFVGPTAATLELFGDKVAARALAQRCEVPVLAATDGPTDIEGATAFFSSLGAGAAVMVKALAGGGGRGMRPVSKVDDLAEALTRCSSEALGAFGNGDVYVEQLLPAARHVEVQVIGDGINVSHVWERECSVQRQRQKLVEIAPAPELPAAVRARLLDASVRLASAVEYRSLGTIEFLVEANGGPDAAIAFIETNARVQVEHTVTEQVTGVDLVAAQLMLAGGQSLEEVGLDQERVPAPVGFAVQARVNLETMQPDGSARPSGGTLHTYDPPAGPGLRTDGYGYAGYATSPNYDSLVAKVIGQGPTFEAAASRTARSLAEFRIEGVGTNISFLRALLSHPDLLAGEVHTLFVEEQLEALMVAAESDSGARFVSTVAPPATSSTPGAGPPLAGAVEGPPEGTVALLAPLQGTVISMSVAVGDEVAVGQSVLVMESMKMEHVVKAESSGVVRAIGAEVGVAVYEGHALLHVEEGEVSVTADDRADAVDLDLVRPDLAEVLERRELLTDERRQDAVARRRKTGHRTARENLTQLVDPGSWVEYGSSVVAAQRTRRSDEDLIHNTPADGMVSGIGAINGASFDEEASQAVVMAYDYTVLAGTQGVFNHYKKDRMMELARDWRLPVVFLAEGGGGRPGDVDAIHGWGLDLKTFYTWGELSGTVPLVGVTTGRCFAGNAVVLGCCDVVIATEGSNIGMGGPAMIEGGGLGVYRPEEVGPLSVQVPGGVVDIVVEDEIEAMDVAKQYLSYFQGRTAEWTAPDQRRLRHIVPENRLRIYEVREVLETLFDEGSVLEIRKGFGDGMVTALARIEGRPVGVIANNPAHLGGAIDSDAADKATRFLQLCDAFDLPIVSLCDTPGNMVGPEYEKQALVRHCCRMFVTASSVTVPYFTVVLRKSYGLGGQGMAAGSTKSSFWTVAWPTGEFGPMGLEGAVRLGFRKELDAVADVDERNALFEKLLAEMYDEGKALNSAMRFEIDDVIDPAETRHWILAGLKSTPVPGWRQRETPKRPCVDTW